MKYDIWDDKNKASARYLQHTCVLYTHTRTPRHTFTPHHMRYMLSCASIFKKATKNIKSQRIQCMAHSSDGQYAEPRPAANKNTFWWLTAALLMSLHSNKKEHQILTGGFVLYSTTVQCEEQWHETDKPGNRHMVQPTLHTTYPLEAHLESAFKNHNHSPWLWLSGHCL